MTQEKFSTLIVSCLLQKYGHFCSIHTSSSLLHVLSSTSVDVTYQRGKKKLCILSYLFLLSGRETSKRGSDLSWLCQYWPPSSREKEKLRTTNSSGFPIFYAEHQYSQGQPESSLCSLSLVLRTQLSLWSHPTPSINVLHSFCFSLYFSLRAKNMFQDCSRGSWDLLTCLPFCGWVTGRKTQETTD